MNIPKRQIASKNVIGHVKGRKVWQIDLIGGLSVVAAEKANDNGLEIAGMSSHPLMARHIAKRHLEDLVLNTLEKSEDADFFGPFLDFYVQETAEARALQGIL